MRDTITTRLPILAAAINTEHRAAFGFAEKAIKHAAECGRWLIEAKGLLPHGAWLPWLEANTEVSVRQSQKYMRLAQGWEEIKCAPSSHLSINTALELIADPKPKAPQRRRCISAAEVGEATLIHRGWFPNVGCTQGMRRFAARRGGGPWPSDIAEAYAGSKIGPPLATLTWQKKAAEFHWSGRHRLEEKEPEEQEEDAEDEWDKFEKAQAEYEEATAHESSPEEQEAIKRQISSISAEEPDDSPLETAVKHCPHCGGVLP